MSYHQDDEVNYEEETPSPEAEVYSEASGDTRHGSDVEGDSESSSLNEESEDIRGLDVGSY